MPDLTNTVVNAAGQPVAYAPVSIELVGTWSADGVHETLPGAVWSGKADPSGVWAATLPAQSAYEGDTYYLVRERIVSGTSVSHTCTVADSPSTQQLRDRLMTPVPTAAATGIALDDLTDVSTSGALAGKVLGFDGALWAPVTASGGGGGSVNSVTAGDSTITVAGTASDPTVAVNVIPESKVTNLVTDLAGKAASVHTHTESQVTGLVSDLAGKAATSHSHAESDVTGLVSDLSSIASSLGGKSNTGHTHAESDVTSLVSDLASKAADSAVVHNTGAENVGGVKTFTSAPVVPAPGAAGNPVRNDDTRLSDARTPTTHSHSESDVTNLISDLAGKAMKLTATAVKTSNYTAVAGDLVRGDTSGGVFTVTLPASTVGTLIGIKKTDPSANALNFAVTGGDTIDGASSGSLVLANQSRIFLGVTGGWTVPYGLNSLSSLDARYVAASGVTAADSTITVAGTATSPTIAVNAIAESKVTNLVTDLAAKARKLVPTSTKTANYTAQAGELVICDASAGPFTVTLPAAAADVPAAVRKGDSSSNAVVVAAAGSDTIGVVSPVSSYPLMVPGQTFEAIGVSGGWVPISAPTPDAWVGLAATLMGQGTTAGALTLNNAFYTRVQRGFVRLASKIGIVVGTSSGNISVAVYRNTGTGRSAVPGTRVATSGAVACPAAGYNELALDVAVDVSPGDWLGLSVDNTGATFYRLISTGSPVNPWCLKTASSHPCPTTPGTPLAAAIVLEVYAVP